MLIAFVRSSIMFTEHTVMQMGRLCDDTTILNIRIYSKIKALARNMHRINAQIKQLSNQKAGFCVPVIDRHYQFRFPTTVRQKCCPSGGKSIFRDTSASLREAIEPY